MNKYNIAELISYIKKEIPDVPQRTLDNYDCFYSKEEDLMVHEVLIAVDNDDKTQFFDSMGDVIKYIKTQMSKTRTMNYCYDCKYTDKNHLSTSQLNENDCCDTYQLAYECNALDGKDFKLCGCNNFGKDIPFPTGIKFHCYE
jgi:hypothetical protein